MAMPRFPITPQISGFARRQLSTVSMRASRLWTPARTQTGLWLDAADRSTITTVSEAVSEWRDKSGNGRHATQGTAIDRPIYANQSVQFDGKWLSVPVSAGLIDGFSIVAVMQSSATGGVSAGLINILSTPSDNPELRFGIGDEIRHYYNGGYAISVNASATNRRILCVEHTAGIKAELFADGVSVTSGTRAGSLSPISEFSIGKYMRTGLTRNGTLWEMIVYPSGTQMRQKLEGYLAHKWGLTANLPSNHPYRLRAP